MTQLKVLMQFMILCILTFILTTWRHAVDQELLSTRAALDTGDRLLVCPC